MSTLIDASDTNEVLSIFARHETFHPRFGWLKKGFDQVCKTPDIFARDDAPVMLGVGKNMVNAIRYWCLAFKLIKEAPGLGTNTRKYNPTNWGKQLLGADGWDPFLEDPASLWLLHWELLKPPCHAPAWHYAFNIFHQVEFTADELFAGLHRYKEQFHSKAKAVDSSLQKDVSCVLRMYLQHRALRGPAEDSLDSPFAALGLLHAGSSTKHVAFRIGPKVGLPPAVIVATSLDFAARRAHGEKTFSLSRLLYDEGSPGRAFKLTESCLVSAIEQVYPNGSAVRISDTAGMVRLSFDAPPEELRQECLSRFYPDRRPA